MSLCRLSKLIVESASALAIQQEREYLQKTNKRRGRKNYFLPGSLPCCHHLPFSFLSVNTLLLNATDQPRSPVKYNSEPYVST